MKQGITLGSCRTLLQSGSTKPPTHKDQTSWITGLVIHAAIVGILLVGMSSAMAQLLAPASPTNLTAKWSVSGSSSVIAQWTAPQSHALITGYAVYAMSGEVESGVGNNWQLVDVTTSSTDSAVLTLAMLGITHAQTMSFVVKSIVITNADTLKSEASNIAVAEFDTAKAILSIKFTSTPTLMATVGTQYTYTAHAVSSDTAAVIIYALVEGPKGIVVDSSSGLVTWTATATGNFNVVLSATDNHSNSTRQEFIITVNARETQHGNVSGFVTDSATGKAIADAQLTFQLFDSLGIVPLWVISAETNDSGMFSFLLPVGLYSVKAQAEGYITAYFGNIDSFPGSLLSVIANTKDTANFMLKARAKGEIIGKVTNVVSGKAIDSARVTAILTGDLLDSLGIKIPGYGLQFSTLTSDSGIYTLNLASGIYLLNVQANGYISQWSIAVDSLRLAHVITVTGSAVDTVNFALQPIPPPMPCVVSGSVISTTGSAIAGATVKLTMLDNDFRDDDSLFTSTVITDQAGAFSDTVPCGETYIVAARDSGFLSIFFHDKLTSLSADRIRVEQSVSGITLVLAKQTVSSTKLSGTIYGCDSVLATVPSKVIAFTLTNDGYFHAATSTATDSTGNYTFLNLAAGTYILAALPSNFNFAPGFYTDTNQCTFDWHSATRIKLLDSSSISGLNIYLHGVQHHHGFTRIIGKVKDLAELSGDIMTGIVVTVSDSTGGLVEFGETDSLGNFDIENIDAGTYFLGTLEVDYSTVAQGSVTTDYQANATSSGQVSQQPDPPSSTTNVTEPFISHGPSTMLAQNYPNPFGPVTEIAFSLPANDHVSLMVYTVTGVKVATLIDGEYEAAGSYRVMFNAGGLPDGTYLYRLQTSHGVVAKSMQVMR